MLSIFIQDGFTLTGKIAARPGLHGEVCFVYRPALPEDVYEYQRKRDAAKTAREQLDIDARLLVDDGRTRGHIESWDVVDVDDKPIPLTVATIRRLYTSAINTLLNHVTGYVATFEDAEKN